MVWDRCSIASFHRLFYLEDNIFRPAIYMTMVHSLRTIIGCGYYDAGQLTSALDGYPQSLLMNTL